jgi:hypothetical protein
LFWYQPTRLPHKISKQISKSSIRTLKTTRKIPPQ